MTWNRHRWTMMIAPLCVLSMLSCEEGEGPELPTEFACPTFSPLDAPEETVWNYNIVRDGGITSVDGTEGEWIRGSGYIEFERVNIFVDEPATLADAGRCKLDVTALIYAMDDGGAKFDAVPVGGFIPELDLFYLSNGAIQAVGEFLLERRVAVPGGGVVVQQATLDVDFTIAEKTCSNEVDAPTAPEYTISLAASPTAPADEFYSTDVTLWDRNIDLIVLGPNPGTSGPEHGMHLTILEPVRAEGDSCVVTLTRAQLTITDDRENPTDIRFYEFPTEDAEPTAENSWIKVDYMDDVKISGEGLIPMQRMDAFGWQEKQWVHIVFDAFEPGYKPPKAEER